MNRYLIAAIPALFLGSVALAADDVAPALPSSPPGVSSPGVSSPGVSSTAVLLSGINQKNFDDTVRIQDNFYLHVNGTWVKTAEIPADRAFWGAFDELYEATLPQLRAIIEEAAADPKRVPDSDAQKIGDLYASFMNQDRLETLGLKPLAGDFALIDGLNDKSAIPALLAHLAEVGINVPYAPNVHLDNRDSTKYVVDFEQGGLGLPDRDYYLKKNDPKLHDARVKYEQHIVKMLELGGDQDAVKKAKDILKLETALARVQWSRVQLRDPVKAYNKIDIAKLGKLMPGYGWQQYLDAAGITGKVDYVIVGQPSYMKGFNQLLKSTPLPVWKEYFSWQVLTNNSSLLSKAYDEENFAFNGKELNGVPQQLPRWKRAVGLEENAIGESVGKLYVAKYFPPENKARMEKLVANLLEAFRQSVDTLDWMSPETKLAAKAKLATFNPKIGYPASWRDYSNLKIDKDDLFGNVQRATVFEYNRNLNKLGKPVDRGEWTMTPQTINAYYNPEMNEIVFPAAILQPPFFNAQADDAVNYGSIGAVIGHEISHGFDDQGAQYDGAGNLHNWWTDDDKKKFAAKTAALVKQYSAYEPLKGYHVNGELTLGENIADNSGLAIAYKAYKISLQGKEPPVIDGFTGFQRFYIGFGQVWTDKARDNALVRLLTTDPHAPGSTRAYGTVRNQPGFYDAFGVKAGDAMYLPPEQRVIMW